MELASGTQCFEPAGIRAPYAVRCDLRDAEDIDLDEKVKRIYRHEPYRLKISYMMERLLRLTQQVQASWIRMHNPGPGRKRAVLAATTGRLLSRTWICSANVSSGRLRSLREAGPLQRILVRARTFGFHMAALDVRQHSRIHEQAVTAILRAANVHNEYASLDESEKIDLLSGELENPRALLPRDAELPETAQRVVESFEVIREIVQREPSPWAVTSSA